MRTKSLKVLWGITINHVNNHGVIFLFFKPSKVLAIVSAAAGCTISLFISLFILHRLVKREMIKDELDRKEQIKKEQTIFR